MAARSGRAGAERRFRCGLPGPWRIRWRQWPPSGGCRRITASSGKKWPPSGPELQELEEYRRENAEAAGDRRVSRERASPPDGDRSSSLAHTTSGFRPSRSTGEPGTACGRGLPVVNAQGVVGYLESVTASTARVLLGDGPQQRRRGVVIGLRDAGFGRGDGRPGGPGGRRPAAGVAHGAQGRRRGGHVRAFTHLSQGASHRRDRRRV